MSKTLPVTIAKVNIVARNYDETVEFYRMVGVNIPSVLAKMHNAQWRGATTRNSIFLTAQLTTREAVDLIYKALIAAGHESVQLPYDAF